MVVKRVVDLPVEVETIVSVDTADEDVESVIVEE